MINRNDLVPIGSLLKPHGVGGEVVAFLDVDVDLKELGWVMLDIDGLFVPFHINKVRQKSSDTDLLSIEGITSEAQAAEYIGKKLYAAKTDVERVGGGVFDEGDEEGVYADELAGYAIGSADGTLKGEITAVDTSTANTLLVVRTTDGKTVFVPLADEFIEELEPDKKELLVNLPEGLVNLNP